MRRSWRLTVLCVAPGRCFIMSGIMSDLFPGKKRPELDYGALFAVMKLIIQRKGLQPHPFFITKVLPSAAAAAAWRH